MAILTVTDADFASVVGNRAAMVLFSTGEGLRSEFVTAFRKAATEHPTLIFAQIDPTHNPALANAYAISDKPMLIGLANGVAQVRRPRPWGADVILTIELLMTIPQQDLKPTPVQESNPMEELHTVVSGKPVHVTEDRFKEDVIDFSHELPVLVDFWAEWCGPCRMVAPIMEKLAAEFAGQVRIAKVDTDANQGISQALRIMSIPTIMAFKDGQLVFNQAGAFPEPAFRDLVTQLIALDVAAATAAAPDAQQN